MLEVIEKNKIYIVIGIAVFCLFASIFYFTTKNKRIMNHISDLNERIEELEEVLQNFDNNKIQKKNVSIPSMNVLTPNMNMPNMNMPNMNMPNMNINRVSIPNMKNESPYKEFIKKKEPKHVSFTTHIEEIEEKEEIKDEDLDAELEEELKDLEKEDLKDEEIDLKDEEIDLKDEEEI